MHIGREVNNRRELSLTDCGKKRMYAPFTGGSTHDQLIFIYMELKTPKLKYSS